MEVSEKMRRVLLAGVVAGLLLPTSAAHGQVLAAGERGIEAAFFTGASFYGAFLERTGRATLLDSDGRPLASDEFRRTISARGAGSIGAALSYWFTPTWAVRVHGSYSRSRFTVDDEPVDDDDDTLSSAGLREPGRLAPLTVRTYDASLVFRIPARVGELAPYALLGGGVISYRAHPKEGRDVPVGARGAFSRGTRRDIAGVAGIGTIYSLGRASLAVEVTDHISRSPVHDRRVAEELRLDDVIVDIPQILDDEFGARPRRVTNNFQLVAGVTFMVNIGR